MKSCHFFRFYKRFYKKRERALMHQSMRIEKLGKVGLCFITGYFRPSLDAKFLPCQI